MPVGQVLLGHRVQVERRVLLEGPQRQALGLHRRDDLLLEDLLVEQVLHADAQPCRLVGVAGADAAAGRADLQAAELGLAGGVQQQVVGHDQVRVGGDAQAADVDPPRAQRVELLDQHLRVDHHAVADHAALARVEDARGDQVQLPLLAVAHDRVPGVVAALEAHDGIAVLGEQIGDLALALIAPLGADYDYARHRGVQSREASGARGTSAPAVCGVSGRPADWAAGRLSCAIQRQRIAARSRPAARRCAARRPRWRRRRRPCAPRCVCPAPACETVVSTRRPICSASSSGIRLVVATIARSAW